MSTQRTPPLSANHDPRTFTRRVFLVAYLGMLLLPLGLLVDVLRTIAHGEAQSFEFAVFALSALWLLGGILALLLYGERLHFVKGTTICLRVFYVVCISLLILEGGIRLEARYFDKRPLLFKPGAKIVFDLKPWGMTGVSPSVTFTVNKLGLRGPMPPVAAQAYKIITVGGSTTECAALDDSQDWSHLLMQALDKAQSTYQVWVGNAGVSGFTTVDHLSCLRRLPILSDSQVWVFLIGVNDMEAALEYGGASTQQALEYKAEVFAEHAPHGVSRTGSVLRRSWFVAALKGVVSKTLAAASIILNSSKRPNEHLISVQAAARSGGPVLPLPDLTLGLREYSERIKAIEQECSLHHHRCIFLTQPSIWRADLSASELSLLWFGRIGHKGVIHGYASVTDLAKAMEEYNQTLLDLCHSDHLECYDLAAFIPKSTAAFYDDVHFNIGGGQLVAKFLSERFLATPPLNRLSESAAYGVAPKEP